MLFGAVSYLWPGQDGRVSQASLAHGYIASQSIVHLGDPKIVDDKGRRSSKRTSRIVSTSEILSDDHGFRHQELSLQQHQISDTARERKSESSNKRRFHFTEVPGKPDATPAGENKTLPLRRTIPVCLVTKGYHNEYDRSVIVSRGDSRGSPGGTTTVARENMFREQLIVYWEGNPMSGVIGQKSFLVLSRGMFFFVHISAGHLPKPALMDGGTRILGGGRWGHITESDPFINIGYYNVVFSSNPSSSRCKGSEEIQKKRATKLIMDSLHRFDIRDAQTTTYKASRLRIYSLLLAALLVEGQAGAHSPPPHDNQFLPYFTFHVMSVCPELLEEMDLRISRSTRSSELFCRSHFCTLYDFSSIFTRLQRSGKIVCSRIDFFSLSLNSFKKQLRGQPTT
ncbi:hypothetical protein J6590_098431 [Homalodisca vitripennis]|nr:hypothetical protein J6590_098431 [Homalodisca vitripennis]